MPQPSPYLTSFKVKALIWMVDEFLVQHPEMAGQVIRMAELGCGVPFYAESLLDRYQNLSYVGVEQDRKSFNTAHAHFKGNRRVTILSGDGGKTGLETESCDIVYSFSALEHVKYLSKFLKESVRIAKRQALIVHRYDLGHALSTTSLKERLHVFLSNRFPFLVPAIRFTCYVDEQKTSSMMGEYGAPVYKSSYHQMPNHKSLVKHLQNPSGRLAELISDLIEWEYAISPELENMSTSQREKHFPTVALWCRKTG